MKTNISLCICTYNRYDVLSNAIDSVVNQSLEKHEYEIIVLDNSPDQQEAKSFGAQYAGVGNLRYVLESNPGLSNARNIAARTAKSPLIAFMDDDAIASPQWAEEILAAFDRTGARTMIVGGKVDPIWSAPRPPWLHDAMLGSLSVVDWGGETRVAGENEWVAGTNIAFRVEAIAAQGGFPRNLGRIGSGSVLLSNEEIELIARIRAAGGHLVYAPRAVVNHLVDVRRLTRAWFRKRAAWQALSDFLMQPDRAAAGAGAQWPHLVQYFNALPPLERTLRGLAYDTDDPALFRWQTSAVYTATTLMLAGFEGAQLD